MPDMLFTSILKVTISELGFYTNWVDAKNHTDSC